MHKAFEIYEQKMTSGSLAIAGTPLFGFLDATLEWNRHDPAVTILAPLFDCLAINSLLFARPAPLYNLVIDYLAQTEGGTIHPRDCETRTFLHDLPIAGDLKTDAILPHLKHRKGVIVPGHGIITYGSVSIEQAYVTFSSFCFASLVKFFSDTLTDARRGTLEPERRKVMEKAAALLPTLPAEAAPLASGPFTSERQVRAAMAEAGRAVVSHHLVDSYFGNISCCFADTLFISQTGSSLDQLTDCIDPCPMDGSSCAGLTASSELTAHMGIIARTGCATILHGHPPFAVILSMDCDVPNCDCGDICYLKCPHPRNACGVPIVSGEVGTGPYGLCNTVPPVITEQHGAIVYGHGVFTIGSTDFNHPLRQLLKTEQACRDTYFRRITALSV